MKHLLVAISLVIPNSVFAFEGSSWLQVNKNGNSIECPDFVEFTNNKYTIFNDCYGKNPANPIIEAGSYILEGDNLSFERKNIIKSLSFINNGLATETRTRIIKKNTKEMEIKVNGVSIYFKGKLPYNKALK